MIQRRSDFLGLGCNKLPVKLSCSFRIREHGVNFCHRMRL